jgi:hypothetical protein
MEMAVVARRRLQLAREDFTNIRDWARMHFRIDRGSRRLTESTESIVFANHVGELGVCHLPQRLQVRCERKDTLVFAGDETLPVRKSTAAICDGFLATVDRQSLSLLIVAVPAETVVVREVDPTFAYADGIAVSRNGLFCVVDFDFGLSQCFRIRYAAKKPCACVAVNEFSWRLRVRSVPDGVHCLVASAVDQQLVLWEMFSGGIHRIVQLDGTVIALAQDEEYGVWAATAENVYFVSMNGVMLAKTGVSKVVTNMAVMPLHRAQTAQVLVCGTADGDLYLLQPLFMTGMVDFVKLASPHSHSIDKIVISPSGKSFLSIDVDEVCYHWKAPGGKECELKATSYSSCAICTEPPHVFCSSCTRALCRICDMTQDGRCPLCSALEMY